MPQARKDQISLLDTPYYHCVSRCVRRSFLCGKDPYSGRSFEHRRDWVESRLLFLSSVFSISLCAYAVMSNHTHVVIHVDKDLALGWSADEVLTRYHQLHRGTLLTQKFMSGDTLSSLEANTLAETVAVYRARLHDISWFMRELNEYIAREANKEDGCTGRFWEGRFKSQALLDEGALLACMAYVDLNPIRARINKTPESASHTSIKKRIEAVKDNRHQPKSLMPFIGSQQQEIPKGIAYNLKDYIELVDITCRRIRQDYSDYIENSQNLILQRLGLGSRQWLSLASKFEKHFCYAAGSELLMNEFKKHTNHRRLRGMGSARTLLSR